MHLWYSFISTDMSVFIFRVSSLLQKKKLYCHTTGCFKWVISAWTWLAITHTYLLKPNNMREWSLEVDTWRIGLGGIMSYIGWFWIVLLFSLPLIMHFPLYSHFIYLVTSFSFPITRLIPQVIWMCSSEWNEVSGFLSFFPYYFFSNFYCLSC